MPKGGISEEKYKEQLYELFTFATPVRKREFLAGRRQQLQQMDEALRTPGAALIVYGDRGVGKTSLTYAALEGKEHLTHACAVEDKYGDIFCDILRRLGETVETESTRKFVAGAEGTFGITPGLAAKKSEGSESSSTFQPISPEAIGPELVAERVAQHQARLSALFIDEFDRIEDHTVHRLVAETIKLFSDRDIRTKIILVGIADVLHELFRAHASVERSIFPIQVPRMSHEELGELIDQRGRILDLTFADPVRPRIIELSDGFPSYTHSLSLHACQSAYPRGVVARRPLPFLERREIEVTENDLQSAVGSVIERNKEVRGIPYEMATTGTSGVGTRIRASVLGACARSDHPWFSETQVLSCLKKLGIRVLVPERSRATTGRRPPVWSQVTPARVSQILRMFCAQENGSVLRRDARGRYRFNDPLFGGYIKLREFAQQRRRN